MLGYIVNRFPLCSFIKLTIEHRYVPSAAVSIWDASVHRTTKISVPRE